MQRRQVQMYIYKCKRRTMCPLYQVLYPLLYETKRYVHVLSILIMFIIVRHANLVSILQFEMKLRDLVPTFLRKGNIIMRHRGGINSHRLTTQCCHAPTFYTRPILPLRHGFMYFVLLHALLLEHRQLPSHTCFRITLI